MVKRLMSVGLCLLFFSGVMISEGQALQAKSSKQLTAQYFLRSLPAEVFDQTEWPLSEDEKNYLIETGRTKQWFVKEKNADLLVISSATPEKSELRLKVFRNNDGGGIIVVGTEGTLPCMAQFWTFDKNGAILPLDEEPLVDVSDYFVTMSYLPPSIGYSVTFCLRDNDRVEALPSFWNIAGLLEIPMEKRVFLVWNNNTFEKTIEFRSILLESERVEAPSNGGVQQQSSFANGAGGVPIVDLPENQADSHEAAESDASFLEENTDDSVTNKATPAGSAADAAGASEGSMRNNAVVKGDAIAE